LERIAKEASLPLDDLTQLSNPLDQASYLARRLSTTSATAGEPPVVSDREARLRQRVCAIIGENRYYFSLMHSLLAALPVSQVVTTNYDQFFEVAWEVAVAQNRHQLRASWPVNIRPDSAHAPVVTSVIPHRIRPDARRWLLKMHGCVSQPDSIVLTRESYIRYSYQWAALEGILQATLITQHMLFVGFSLADDNFLRILDGVRRIVRPVPGLAGKLGPFGTALTTDPPQRTAAPVRR
jgi:hypothetical protein